MSKAESTMNECNVCCDTKSRLISCIYCNYEACISCNKRYLLSTSNDACCMKCNKAWNREFISDNMSNTFLNKDLKKHREEVLFDREKARFPETAKKVVEIKDIDKKLKIITEPIRNLSKQIKALEKQIEDLKLQRYNKALSPDYQSRWNLIHRKELLIAGKIKSSVKEPPRMCMIEECKGYISKGKCDTCDTYFCSTCYQVKQSLKDKTHTCKESDIETVKLLKANTKPCPKCGEGIFRVQGCNQMWCTSCDTPFDWKTGKVIVRGFFHNPHYFEWRKRTGGNAFLDQGRNREGGCQGDRMPSINKIQNILTKHKMPFKERERISCLIQLVQEQRDYARDIPQPNNNELRIKHLSGDITEKAFKRTIQQREKKYQKEQELALIWRMFCSSVIDILNNLVIKNGHFYYLIENIDNLIEYTNDSFKKLGNTFKNKYPKIVYETRKGRRSWSRDVTKYYATLV